MITYKDKMIKTSPRTKKEVKDSEFVDKNEKGSKKQRTKTNHNQSFESKTRNNTNR